jgi:DNA polymerase-1
VPVEIDQDELKRKDPDNAALLKILKTEFPSLLKYVTGSPKRSALYGSARRKSIQEMIKALSAAEFCFDTETTSLDPMQAELVGISFATEPLTCVLPSLGHAYPGAPEAEREHALSGLKPVMEDPARKRSAKHQVRPARVRPLRVPVKGIAFDTMLASYLLNPGNRPQPRRDRAQYLNYKTVTYAEVAGSGKNRSVSAVDIPTATNYSGEDADITLRLKQTLAPPLKEHNLERLFIDIEMPLMKVLADMERIGISGRRLSGHHVKKLGADMARIEKGHLRTGRRGVQHQLSETALGGPLRETEIDPGQEDQDRVLDQRGRARRAGPAAPPARGDPQIPHALEAQVDVR